jgi:hypothetical protein
VILVDKEKTYIDLTKAYAKVIEEGFSLAIQKNGTLVVWKEKAGQSSNVGEIVGQMRISFIEADSSI